MRTDGQHRGPRDPRPSHATFQYGTQCEYTNSEGQVIVQRVYRQPSKAIAEEVARDWCISPLRNGPRYAHLMRRRGWDGTWAPIADWASPEATR